MPKVDDEKIKPAGQVWLDGAITRILENVHCHVEFDIHAKGNSPSWCVKFGQMFVSRHAVQDEATAFCDRINERLARHQIIDLPDWLSDQKGTQMIARQVSSPTFQKCLDEMIEARAQYDEIDAAFREAQSALRAITEQRRKALHHIQDCAANLAEYHGVKTCLAEMRKAEAEFEFEAHEAEPPDNLYWRAACHNGGGRIFYNPETNRAWCTAGCEPSRIFAQCGMPDARPEE